MILSKSGAHALALPNEIVLLPAFRVTEMVIVPGVVNPPVLGKLTVLAVPLTVTTALRLPDASPLQYEMTSWYVPALASVTLLKVTEPPIPTLPTFWPPEQGPGDAPVPVLPVYGDAVDVPLGPVPVQGQHRADQPVAVEGQR